MFLKFSLNLPLMLIAGLSLFESPQHVGNKDSGFFFDKRSFRIAHDTTILKALAQSWLAVQCQIRSGLTYATRVFFCAAEFSSQPSWMRCATLPVLYTPGKTLKRNLVNALKAKSRLVEILDEKLSVVSSTVYDEGRQR